jgi:hypothetical protein
MYYVILKVCPECFKKIIDGEIDLPNEHNYIISEWKDANLTCECSTDITELPSIILSGRDDITPIPSEFYVAFQDMGDVFNALKESFAYSIFKLIDGDLHIHFPHCGMTTDEERWIRLYNLSSTYRR